MTSYTHREITPADFPLVCSFPQTEEELYFMFPKGIYPFSVEQLQASVNNRFDSTVVLHEEAVVGFANFYEVQRHEHCCIGNVVVHPQFRGRGVGRFLISTMEMKAKAKYDARESRISCLCQNTKGLLLYHGLGYVPYALETRMKHDVASVLVKLRRALA